MQNADQPSRSFTASLYAKAAAYFQAQPALQYATRIFYIKGLLLVIIYLAAYACFLFFAGNLAELLACAFILGICHVFIPVNLSHDAIHGSVSPRKWLNDLFRYGFEITGSNSYMYGLKHLEAHHDKENGSKTKAIESQGLLLQTHRAKRTRNLPLVSYLFYAQYMIFVRDPLLYLKSTTAIPKKEILKLCVFKSVYAIAFLVLPFIMIAVPWWQVLLSLLFMYLIVTLALVIILLMPTEKMAQTRLTGNNTFNEQWVIEILEHNVDFSPNSLMLNLLAGGANLNVVHYLFPSANHVHYNKIAAIIEETAGEYGLAYRKQVVKDVFGIHFNYLKNIQSANR